MARLQRKSIAAALGVTPGRVSQMAKQGMPTNSIEAALAWKRQNVVPRITCRPPHQANRRPAVAADGPIRLDGLDATLAAGLGMVRGLAIGRILAELKARGVVLGTDDAAIAFAAVAEALAEQLEAAGEPESLLWALTGEPPAVVRELAEAHAAKLRAEWAAADTVAD
jgi:hypothetical protein